MVKLFLVEDEIIMRDGIKKHIDWKGEDIDFCGEASDGELAFPMILKLKPDILVTDIKMPFMDGLELSKLVRKELPNLRIIILSGYDEFTYAQEAVSIGVEEYLLKPISPAKLLSSIKKVKDKIELSRDEAGMLDWTKEELLERNAIEQQKLFRAMVSGSMTMSELLDAGKKLNIELTARFYQVTLFNLSFQGESGDIFSEKQNSFWRQVNDYLEMVENSYIFDRGTEGLVLLTLAETEEDVEIKRQQVIDRMIAISKNIVDGNYFVGIGSVVNRLSEIGKSYDNANKAFSYRYFNNPNQIIDYKNLTEPGADSNNLELDIKTVTFNEKNKQAFEKFLRSGAQDEVNHFIDEIFTALGDKNTRSLLFLNYITMDLYFAIVAFIHDLGYETEDLGEEFADINIAIKGITNSETARKYLKKGLNSAIKLRDSNSVKKYSVVLKKVLAYINENFDKDDISLNVVASIANISPNHFSTIFSQEMGVTFIEYLIGKRMEKAKELLMTTNLRSSEIAYKVGYKDPHYFSFMFKKTQGMTTREYRNRGKN